MSDQPEALRLADALEDDLTELGVWGQDIADKAANELRRLQAENEALRADAQRYRKLTANADFAASIVADAYSTWDTDEDWGPWLTAAIDEGKA